MTESPDQWYVQMDLGMSLGPMHRDDLVSLAATGSLLERDKISNGRDGPWCRVADIPGLLEGRLPATLPDPPTADPHPVVPRDDSRRTVRRREHDSRVRQKRRRKTRPRSDDDQRSASRVAPTPKVASSPSVSEHAAPASSRDTTRRTPPSPAENHAVQHESDFVLKMPDDDLPDAAIESDVDQDANVGTALDDSDFFEPVEQPSEDDDESSDEAVEFLQAPAPSPARVPTTSRRPVASPASRRPVRPARSSTGRPLLKWGLIAAALGLVVIVPVALLPLAPEQDSNEILAAFVEIHHELHQHRENAPDQPTWTAFVERASPRVEESLPWLEQEAGPGDAKMGLLLYAGRGLQEILSQPADYEYPHQARLDGLFERLEE